MTTAVTAGETELVFEALYKDFISEILAGSDVTATKASFKTQLESLQVNTTQVDNYLSSLAYYISVANDMLQVGNGIDGFEIAEKKFIQSFKGLENIDYDPLFALDVRNCEFNDRRLFAFVTNNVLRANPAGTYAYFTDASTPRNFAIYTAKAIEVSNRIKSGL